MITMWKRIFRNRFSTVYFVMGLLISMFTLLDVLSAYNRALQYEEDCRAFAYAEEAYMDIAFSDVRYMDELARLDEQEGVNIELSPFYVNIYGTTYGVSMSVLVQSDADSHYLMESGGLPPTESAVPSAAIGREYKPFTTQEEGISYIQLEQVKYQVTGVIGSPYSDYQDYGIVIPYSSLTESQKEKLYKEHQTVLIFQSDTVGLQEPLQRIYEQIIKLDPKATVQVSAKSSEVYQNKVDTTRFPFLFVIYLFCILISVLVSWYWIQAQLREMAIRKAFGEGMGRITWLLLREMLAIFLLAAVLYLALHTIAFFTMGYRLNFRMHGNPQNIFIIAAYFVLTMFMAVVVPVWKIARVQPAELVNSKG